MPHSESQGKGMTRTNMTTLRALALFGLLALTPFATVLLTTDASAAGAPPNPAKATLELAKKQFALPPGAAMELSMRGSTSRPEQARDAAAAFADVPSDQSVVLTEDGRFRLKTRTLYPGSIVFSFLTVGSPQGSSTIDELQWRDGTEISKEDAASARKDYADLLFLSPALLLRDALNRKPVSKPAARNAEPGATQRIEVSFKDAAGRPTTLTLDTASGRIESATSGTRRFTYVGYQKQKTLLQPTRITQYDGDRVATRWNDVTTLLMPAPSPEVFNLPDGYTEAADRSPLRATDLGEGAYRIDGAPSGYHTGFVVGDRAIAVFDAPVSVEEAEQVKAVIEKAAPGKRIAYVVVSHPHGDHVAGLRAYLKDGIEVVTGPGAGVALKRQLSASAQLKLREVNNTDELDLGGRTLKLYAINSTHASSMLVAYAPASRTVFQGDLFYLPEVGPVPPAFDGAGELSTLITASQGLFVERIVGVHGRTGTLDDLNQSLALRKGGGFAR